MTRRVVNLKPAAAPAPPVRPSEILLYRRCEAAFTAADLDRRTVAVATDDGVVVGDAPEAPPAVEAATAAVVIASARPTPPAHVAERIRGWKLQQEREAARAGRSAGWMRPVT